MYHARLLPELLLDQPLPAPDAAAVARPHFLSRRVPPAAIVAALITFLGVDVLLMWRFVDFAPWWGYVGGGVIVAALAIGAARAMRGVGTGPTLATLSVCFATALVLYALGGEGRLFYANTDWMTRDGVLHDMATHPWPYAYQWRGFPEILRAPLGMYLVPSLVMAAFGQTAGDVALLLQHSLFLALLLGLSAQLFATPAKRVAALGVFVLFSGLDIVGVLLLYPEHHWPIPDHLEWWSGLQFSSHITQAFWAPQHALAGWLCAMGFMLWHDRRMPVGVFLMLVPLTVLWSPLSPLGALPFAALAGIVTLARRELRPRDILLPGVASLLIIPTLQYLGASSDTVSGHLIPIHRSNYILFELFEAIPFLFVAFAARCPQRFGWATLVIVTLNLLLMPFWQVGWSADFMMRATIPSLAILSVLTAHLLLEEPRRGRRIAIAILVGIGAVTGGKEVARALRLPASPPPLCTFYHAWGPSPPSDKNTYLAALATLPRLIRPHAVTLLPNHEPSATCWSRPWPRITGMDYGDRASATPLPPLRTRRAARIWAREVAGAGARTPRS